MKTSELKGKVAFWYESLDCTDRYTENEDTPLVAASVIKLFVMLEAFRRFENGTLKKDTLYTIRREDKMPSCGALTYMHDGLSVTVLDLVTLMIILSDNTATNILIDMLGIEEINRTIVTMGIPGVVLRRKLFQSELSAKGIENTITAKGVAEFLRRLYRGDLISQNASREMLDILSDQRLNGKIPFFIDEKIAHKTGEDDGITHDAAIVFGEHPFLLVILSQFTDVPETERFMQNIADEIYRNGGKYHVF